jgi:hypothetical protein
MVVNVVQPLRAGPQTLHTPAQTAVNITLHGEDVSHLPLTYSTSISPSFGTLSGIPPNLTYTPMTNFTGEDVFWFKVSNGISDSQPADVHVIVDPGPKDTTPPEVWWSSPDQGALQVQPATAGLIIVAFSEAMQASTITGTAFLVSSPQGGALPLSVTYDATSYRALLYSGLPLAGGMQYTVKVLKSVKDASGNPMSADYVFTFTTAASSVQKVYLPILKRRD